MINQGVSIASIHDERGRAISIENVFNTVSCDCPGCNTCITVELHDCLHLELINRGWRDVGGLHFCPKHLTRVENDARMDV